MALTYPTDITNNGFYVQFEFKKYLGSGTSIESAAAIPQAGAVAATVGVITSAINGIFNISQIRQQAASLSSLAGAGAAIFASGAALLALETPEQKGAAEITEICKLPIPQKIVDGHNVSWGEVSITDYLMSAAPGGNLVRGAADISSTATGVNINPFNRLYFQKPNFREFTFSWQIAPHNEEESIAIQNIIKTFKTAMSPTSGVAMGYPYLLDVKFFPNNLSGNMELLECAIMGISADFSPNGPSFLNDKSDPTQSSGHPTLINLTLKLKETQLWWRGRYDGSYLLDDAEDIFDDGLSKAQDFYQGIINGGESFEGVTPSSENKSA